MKTIVMNFREPRVLNKIVKNERLELTLDWFGMGTGKSIITKTTSGFNYEDVGYMKRSFNNLDNLMWEFELPKSLRKDIENLSVIDEKKNRTELTKRGTKELNKNTKEFINFIKKGSCK